jgi:hypothetical protein
LLLLLLLPLLPQARLPVRGQVMWMHSRDGFRWLRHADVSEGPASVRRS